LLYMLPLLLNRSLGNVPIGIQDSLSSFAQGFAPLAGLGILSALFSMILLSEERHANTLFESIPSTIVIMVLLLWPSSQAVDPLLWGSLVGFGLQSIGLYILLQRTGANVKPKIAFTSSGWLSLKRNFGIVVLGQFIMSWVDPVSFNIADTLGEGNVSALNYASKIIILFLSLGATAVARAILPVFSNSERENRNRIRLAIQWAGLSFAGGMFAAVLLWVLAEDIVRLVYERGAFSTSDTESIARAVKIGGLQLPFYFSGIVLAQLFVSFGNYKIILTSACVALFVKTVFSLLLVPSMAFTGIILAAVPMYFANNLLFLYKLYNMYKQDDFSHTYY